MDFQIHFSLFFNEKEIRQLYLNLSRKYHPDKGGDHNDFINLKKRYEERLIYIRRIKKNKEIPINYLNRTFISVYKNTSYKSFQKKSIVKDNIEYYKKYNLR